MIRMYENFYRENKLSILQFYRCRLLICLEVMVINLHSSLEGSDGDAGRDASESCSGEVRSFKSARGIEI